MHPSELVFHLRSSLELHDHQLINTEQLLRHTDHIGWQFQNNQFSHPALPRQPISWQAAK